MTARAGGSEELDLSVVVIGLNEAARLPAALEHVQESLRRSGLRGEVLYVDSGSTDGSPELAATWPDVRVLHLPREQANAGRARNLGIQNARGRLVQLLDGDMTVDPDWLAAAAPELDRPELGAVAGQLEEVGVVDSLWNATFGHDWGAQVGPTDALGGAALWRRAVLDELGGFDPDLRVGEDTDLSLRACDLGHTLLRLPARMAGHHLGLQGAKDWWRRGVSVGRSHAGVADRHGDGKRRIAGAGARGELLVAGVGLGIGLLGAVLFQVPWWLGAPAAWLALQGLRAARILQRDRRAGLPLAQALVHSAHVLLVKLPITWGRHLQRRHLSRPQLAGGLR